MPAAHRIRLRGGWKIERRDDGSAVFERSFGSPRTLDARETVWLMCDGVSSDGMVLVNGEVIGSAAKGQPFALEITAYMRPRNVVRFEFPSLGDILPGEVALEFRPAD